MNEVLESLLIKIGLEEDLEYFKNGQLIDKAEYHALSKSLRIRVQLDESLPFEVWQRFNSHLMTAARAKVDLTIETRQDKPTILKLRAYLEYAQSIQPKLKLFESSMPRLEDKRIIYAFADAVMIDEAIQTKHLLEGFLKNVGIDLPILVQELKSETQQVEFKKPEAAPATVYEEKKMSFVPKSKKNQTYIDFKIKDIVEACFQIKITGKIFEKENRALRTGKHIQTLYIADAEDAIVIKRFERGALTLEVMDEIKIGDTVAAYGKVEFDSFSRELVFMPDRIDKIEEVRRMDHAEKKRVELHVHTKLSEMDGVSGISEYIDEAVRWGHDAIAITDHAVVQDFPKAQRYVEKINKGREKPFKMIYGVEMYMVDPFLEIVKNADDTLLEEGRYCVFDLETTGLSTRFDHIIEFGGVLVENRDITSAKQMFIKPPVELSAFTTSLTNITEEHLRNAPTIEEAMDELLAFIGDRILVAHNAQFDVNFLNDALIRMGREPLKNPVIDTLDLSRSLHADRKAHRLGNIARVYNIRYDEEVAHRADYDAKVLAQVYLNMLNDLKHIKTLKDLAGMYDESCFNKVRDKHIMVLAKNKAGLKEMFELITLSHTKYLSYNSKNTNNVVAEPKIFREEIAKRHKNGNLLLGSSCLNGEVFEIAQTRGEDKLKEVIQFYDYIEIQPLGNYMHLVERNSIGSKEWLIEILKSIIKAAQELGKIVVATGDCHYVQPEEKLIRDIYINSQAIGGKRHPLYIYNAQRRRMSQAPDQHLRTTDEMLAEYSYLDHDLAYEMVVTNSNKINDMIEDIKVVYDTLFPPDIKDSDKKLAQICYENAHKKYGPQLPEIVEARLKRELDSIIGHGFYVVYYISHLLVKKSLDDGYMVGSRGSVGSSFVATMANITEVNPLAPHYVCPKCHYVEFFTDGSVASGFDLPDKKCPVCGEMIRGDGQDIPFETFLGFEGDKVPDIDLNFSGDYQPTAHNYLKEVFGEDHVFRAGTIGTVAEQTAYGYVKGYEEEMGMETHMRNAQILRLAKGCEGVKRTTGQHPGGILVVPNEFDVHDFTPVQYPANNPFADWKTTHFEFHDIHDNLLKFDILGHVDPTAMKLLERISGIDPKTIPMNDPETMKIFSSVESLHIDTSKNTEKTGAAGIPEFGTPFVRGILELTRPTTFDELVRISGLSHGTDVWLNNAADLIKEGKCTLKNVIGCRDDIMVYLLHKQLPPKLAFTIMESVRKGKGLKDEWIPVMKEHNVDDWYVDSCLKIKYMFPKAHAVAYVMMAVRIAWFKVHKPQYYYCMFFSIRCDAYDIDTMIAGEQAIRARMAEITQRLNSNEFKNDVSKKEKDIYSTLELALEMVLRGYRFGNINLMKSAASEFIVDPDDENVLIPPFTSIDGLGANVAVTVIEEREKRPFLSKQDLSERTALNGTHIKRLETMGVLSDLQEENQLSLF